MLPAVSQMVVEVCGRFPLRLGKQGHGLAVQPYPAGGEANVV